MPAAIGTPITATASLCDAITPTVMVSPDTPGVDAAAPPPQAASAAVARVAAVEKNLRSHEVERPCRICSLRV